MSSLTKKIKEYKIVEMSGKEVIPPQQSGTEPKNESYSPRDFLEKLYSRVLDWTTTEQKGQVVEEIKPQEIDNWELHDGRHPGETVWLGINLEKGVLIKTPKHDFVLALGRKLQSRHSNQEALSLQFGFQPIPGSKHFEELPLVNKLRSLTNTRGSYGVGEFHEQEITGGIRINCWADGPTYGGKWINRWGQKELLTNKGIDACLEIVQRTTKNAFL